jgi:shikimate dehydrogenase
MLVSEQRLFFIGVSTGSSSIMPIFPRWAGALGIAAEIRGIDVPLNAPTERVHAAVSSLVADPGAVGALVTSHKAAVYEAAASSFDELDEMARLCREISCIDVRSGRLRGSAKDPKTSRQAYNHLLGADPWRDRSSDVVCLGAGGAGLALTVAVLSEAHQPRRYVLTDRSPHRLQLAREIISRLPVRADVDCRLTTGVDEADLVVSTAAPGSLVVNATGMGKDLPGSPVSQAACFPVDGVAWDMNYRGELSFLDLARAQERDRRLTVSDGWRYFLHGWTEVISDLFGIPLNEERFALLDDIAAVASGRPASAGAPRV